MADSRFSAEATRHKDQAKRKESKKGREKALSSLLSDLFFVAKVVVGKKRITLTGTTKRDKTWTGGKEKVTNRHHSGLLEIKSIRYT